MATSTTVKGNLVKYWKIIALVSIMMLVVSIVVIYQLKNSQVMVQEQQVSESAIDTVETVPAAGAEEIVIVDEREKHCLALAMYHEARNQPVEGRIGVAAVVLNRVRTGAHPNSICAVVFDRCQFSWVCDRRKQYNPETHANIIERRAWRDALQLAEDIIVDYNRRTFVDLTHGATFFHADYVRPRWRHRLTKTVQIGAHIFYRA